MVRSFRHGNGGLPKPNRHSVRARCSFTTLPNRRVSSPLKRSPFPRADGISDLGFGGGIVKMPEGCAPTEQVMGTGTTVYYMVESLEKVSLLFIRVPLMTKQGGGLTRLDGEKSPRTGWQHLSWKNGRKHTRVVHELS